jgi:hypothetical protein
VVSNSTSLLATINLQPPSRILQAASEIPYHSSKRHPRLLLLVCVVWTRPTSKHGQALQADGVSGCSCAGKVSCNTVCACLHTFQGGGKRCCSVPMLHSVHQLDQETFRHFLWGAERKAHNTKDPHSDGQSAPFPALPWHGHCQAGPKILQSHDA